MSVAVVGWGSLIWCPGSLKIVTAWRREGPSLPIEFARISSRNRLTLVIHGGAESQPTLWAQSGCAEFEEARKNLKNREGTRLRWIHAVDRKGCRYGLVPDEIGNKVVTWLKDHHDLEAAVWTGLPSNWEEKRQHAFCLEDAIQYLKCLKEQNRSSAAEEYIRNAPAQIRTVVRARVESELKWTANELPGILFEESE